MRTERSRVTARTKALTRAVVLATLAAFTIVATQLRYASTLKEADNRYETAPSIFQKRHLLQKQQVSIRKAVQTSSSDTNSSTSAESRGHNSTQATVSTSKNVSVTPIPDVSKTPHKPPKPTPLTRSNFNRKVPRNITHPTIEHVDECIPAAYHEFPPDLFSHDARFNGGIIVHLLVTIYMFYALAVVCDDYFVASLEECCCRLNMSDDVAGATFMAAGSSAPELFTAILGVIVAKGDVGTGTIVGSAVFNVLFVIGVCGLFAGREVPVTWWPLFRDSVFYALTVFILIVVIWDSEITWIESLFMLFMYGVYIAMMKFNSQLHVLVAQKFQVNEEQMDGAHLSIIKAQEKKNYNSSYAAFSNDDAEQQIHNQTQETNMLSNQHKPFDEVIRDNTKRVTLYEAALMMLMTRWFRPKTRFWAAAKRIANEHYKFKYGATDANDGIIRRTLTSDDSKRRLSRSASIAINAEQQWRKIPTAGDGPLRIICWCLKAPLLATLHYTVPDCRTPQGKKLFLVTFFMSIWWTAFFSYVMVWMVTLIGFSWGIPDSIMGITFLAAGTSIPDAFASLLVAKQGQGDMAIANSLGSNVFDILIGLAFPWLIQTTLIDKGGTAPINSGGILYSVILLFLTIAITIYAIHKSRWMLTRPLGTFLMVVYVFFLLLCSAIEFNLFGYVNPPMCPE